MFRPWRSQELRGLPGDALVNAEVGVEMARGWIASTAAVVAATCGTTVVGTPTATNGDGRRHLGRVHPPRRDRALERRRAELGLPAARLEVRRGRRGARGTRPPAVCGPAESDWQSGHVPRLLVVHHSPTPTVQSLTDAVVAGANDDEIEGVEVVERPALEATRDDVLAADGYLLGTTANFGYMSGALKHFFDTIFLEAGGALSDDGSAGAIHGWQEAVRAVGARPLRHDRRGAVGAIDRPGAAVGAVRGGARGARRRGRRSTSGRRTSWAGHSRRCSWTDAVGRRRTIAQSRAITRSGGIRVRTRRGLVLPCACW